MMTVIHEIEFEVFSRWYASRVERLMRPRLRCGYH